MGEVKKVLKQVQRENRMSYKGQNKHLKKRNGQNKGYKKEYIIVCEYGSQKSRLKSYRRKRYLEVHKQNKCKCRSSNLDFSIL